jgi:glutamine amidotransferase
MSIRAAIIDFGMGILFSVKRACERVGFVAYITSQPSELRTADLAILPGVGAFGDAMDALRRSGMGDSLRFHAASNKPVFGICLGLQLLLGAS